MAGLLLSCGYQMRQMEDFRTYVKIQCRKYQEIITIIQTATNSNLTKRLRYERSSKLTYSGISTSQSQDLDNTHISHADSSYSLIHLCFIIQVILLNKKFIDWIKYNWYLKMDTFQITFIEGVDYVASTQAEQQSFKRIIQESFCLLSWMIPQYQIRIKHEFLIDHNTKVKVFTKHHNAEEYFSIHQRKMDRCIYYALAFHGKKDDYQIIMKEAIEIARQGESIKVEFVDQKTIKYFSIVAECKQSLKAGSSFRDIFLNPNHKKSEQLMKRYNYFRPPCRPSGQSKPTLSNVKYCYIQPQNRRYYQPEGYHLNLAFQGGGAKGVSYVGVNRAIKKMQQRILKESNGEIRLPIRSVIGSSAGGILSLAISAGISDADLTDLCYMMDTLVSDRLFSTAQEADKAEEDPTEFNEKYDGNIQPNFFSSQGAAIKNLFHNLGISQNSLTQILFEILKEPSVQQRLMAVFKAFNPSIAELMSFKDQPQSYAEGESIKGCMGTCCCCCYSNCCWNCCGSYPCCQNFPGSGCFIEKEGKCQKINIYGLLYAALMTGSAVENILAYALSMFLEIQADRKSEKLVDIAIKRKWFNFSESERILLTISKEAKSLRNSYKNNNKDYLQNILMSFSKELTLQEYYDLIGVEFTCTSVDLNDKIERFFNHKTTPHLPICKAVQMTGSFPAAFLSLKWKKEWGKYYIHYDTSRREIDLTDHYFTDGGLLANFPLKFLDNEKFREKYFSHMNVEKKTLLYGFGLDQLDEFPEVDNSEQRSAALASLFQQFKYRIASKFVLYLMSCGTKKTLPNDKVKLFDFLLSLLDALRESDRNLNKECFEEEIVQTTIDKRPIESREELNALKEPISNLLRNLEEKIESHFKKNQDTFLRDEFSAIYQRFYDFDKVCRQGQSQLQKIFNRRLKWQQIQSIQITLEDNILIYSNICIDIYQTRMKDLKKEYSHVDVLKTSSTNHHQFQILQLLYNLKVALMKLPQRQFNEIKKSMKEKCDQFFIAVKEVYEKILIHNPQGQNSSQSLQFIDQKEAISLLHLKTRLTPYVRKNYHDSKKLFDMCCTTPIMSYYVEEQTYLNRANIMNKIRAQIYQKRREISQKDQKLKRPASNIQIHIVFQANNFSHFYFPNYIKIVEEVISEKDLKIDIISCTDFHAIFGVFYALGFDFGKTKKKLSEVHYLFKQNQDIERTYNNKQWMKTSVETVRSLLQNEWKKIQDPFEFIEDQYDHLNDSSKSLTKKDTTNMFNNITNEFEVSSQSLSGAFQKILDYISGSFTEIQKLSSHQRKSRFQQLLGLGGYKKINQSQSKNGAKALDHFLDYTINLLMLTSEYILKSNQFSFFSSKNWSKQLIFKGMVINSLINSFEYRVFIYNTLIEAGLDQNITLQKFYEISERKVLLNFNCVNTTQQRFSLINKITKPNMPLWAALMACASLPYHEGTFDSINQWEINQKSDRIELEKADIVFRNYQAQGRKRGNSYICGNFIASLPLEFMTNQRLIDSKLAQPNPGQSIQIIEIVFAFDVKMTQKSEEDVLNQTKNSMKLIENVEPNEPQKPFCWNIPNLMENNRKFPNLCEALCYLCEFFCCCCCDGGGIVSYFKDILGHMQTLKMLMIRVNSHDNLICHLYYDKLIKLPLRIGTLDFFKINRSRPDLDDTIRQAQQVVNELCQVIQVNTKDKKQLVYSSYNKSTIQISRHRCNIRNKETKNWQQKDFYRMKFISYTKWRDYRLKYIIQYSKDIGKKSSQEVEWSQVEGDFVDLDKEALVKNHYKLLLRFTYYIGKLTTNTFLLDLRTFQIMPQDQPHARAIFQINFKHMGSTLQAVRAINHANISDKVPIKSYYIPRNSNYCSNPDCQAERLKDVLKEEKVGACFECKKDNQLCLRENGEQGAGHIKDKIIAMQCPSCSSTYCLHCKVNHFIVRQSGKVICPRNVGTQYKEQAYKFSYTPLVQKIKGYDDVIRNTCMYCEKYSYKLLHEQGITEGSHDLNAFSCLRICETCSLYVLA